MTQETRLPVLIVEDDAALREALAETLGLAGYAVRVAREGGEALDLVAREPFGLVVSDVQMRPMDGHTLLRRIKAISPETPVMLMTAFGMIEQAVEAMRDGACTYLPKPFEAERLLDEVARYVRPAVLDPGVIAEDPLTRELLALARRVAASSATVLVTGESGTGKEVLARYLHRHSPRAGGPFVAINCAAIPENLLESTLFGHEKGAFTGASATQPGKFEQAHGGTLLLDEISEMPLSLQTKLLRVLQEREVERLGGRGPIPVDVRVLATSNRDMAAEVAAGRFREDLYYRLNVFPLHLPPLRSRRQDILPLARHALGRFAAQAGRPGMALTPDAERWLLAHDWPGNVRELENTLQRALILAPGKLVAAEHLLAAPAKLAASQPGTPTDLKALERRHILETLAAVGGSRKRAAERLGMSERTLRYKLARWREEDALGSNDVS